MKGSIVTRTLKDGSKRYHVVYRAGGKQRWKAFAKRKDADRFLTNMVKTVHDGAYQEVRPAPMKEVIETWLADSLDVRLKLGELKPSTAKSYRSMVGKYFLPFFGECRSDHLSAAVLTDWRKWMAELVADGKLSKKSFNNVLNLLHAILGWAREPARSFLAHDPLHGQKRLKVPRVERDFLEEDEIRALLGAAGSVENEAILHVALYGGLRRGELFGLQWRDVDWKDARLFVRRSVYQGDVTTPKTASSERAVDVPQRLLDALSRHRGDRVPPDEAFVFCSDTGTPLDPDNFYKRVFSEIRKRAKLRSSIGLHALRHTYASLLIRQNESLKYVSRQLGHSSIQLTADTYAHLFKETSTKAMKQLNEAIPEPAVEAAPEELPQRGLRLVGGTDTAI